MQIIQLVESKTCLIECKLAMRKETESKQSYKLQSIAALGDEQKCTKPIAVEHQSVQHQSAYQNECALARNSTAKEEEEKKKTLCESCGNVEKKKITYTNQRH